MEQLLGEVSIISTSSDFESTFRSVLSDIGFEKSMTFIKTDKPATKKQLEDIIRKECRKKRAAKINLQILDTSSFKYNDNYDALRLYIGKLKRENYGIPTFVINSEINHLDLGADANINLKEVDDAIIAKRLTERVEEITVHWLDRHKRSVEPGDVTVYLGRRIFHFHLNKHKAEGGAVEKRRMRNVYPAKVFLGTKNKKYKRINVVLKYGERGSFQGISLIDFERTNYELFKTLQGYYVPRYYGSVGNVLEMQMIGEDINYFGKDDFNSVMANCKNLKESRRYLQSLSTTLAEVFYLGTLSIFEKGRVKGAKDETNPFGTNTRDQWEKTNEEFKEPNSDYTLQFRENEYKFRREKDIKEKFTKYLHRVLSFITDSKHKAWPKVREFEKLVENNPGCIENIHSWASLGYPGLVHLDMNPFNLIYSRRDKRWCEIDFDRMALASPMNCLSFLAHPIFKKDIANSKPLDQSVREEFCELFKQSILNARIEETKMYKGKASASLPMEAIPNLDELKKGLNQLCFYENLRIMGNIVGDSSDEEAPSHLDKYGRAQYIEVLKCHAKAAEEFLKIMCKIKNGSSTNPVFNFFSDEVFIPLEKL